MGYRFSRRIRICKGVHLNVSKSGVGISLGVRGASISTGPRGTYINAGLPGTGLSYRQKISSGPSNKFIERNLVENYQSGSTIEFQIDNDGSETVILRNSSGYPIKNETLVQKVMRSPEYKEIVRKARIVKNDLIIKQNDDAIFFYKSTPKLVSIEDVVNERDDVSGLLLKSYQPMPFNEAEPRDTSFYDESLAFAQATVKTHKFWKKKELIRIATYEKMDELHKKALKEWDARREAHFKTEEQIKEKKDAEYKKEYDKLLVERKQTYEQILNPTDEYLQDTVSDVLSQIELPIDFSIDYAVNKRKIELDIDLPEIEDYPQVTSTILQSGKLSIKKKTITQLNKDYATSVIGMSFFFAGLLFNISPAIKEISMAGYTQRLNKKSGNIEDQYVYSVKYTRDEFSRLNISNIEPLEAIKNFDHIIDVSSKFELKTIDVKQSENRKTSSEAQKIQTEYYKIEPEKKESNTSVVVAELNSSSSSVLEKQERLLDNKIRMEEAQERQVEEYERNKKRGCGCLLAIIIVFVLLIGCCLCCPSHSGKYYYYHKHSHSWDK